MKRLLLLIILFINCLVGYNQGNQYKTCYGDIMSPVDTLRLLNIFINIIFDQCDTCDPLYGKTTPNWVPGQVNTINVNPPSYLPDYMDTDFNPNNIHGTFTKRYAQASFKKFILLGDFMSVNIAQSLITPGDTCGRFGYKKLINSTIKLINDSGGLQTIYGYNSITDYDLAIISDVYEFIPKPIATNNKIDYTQIFIRNCTALHGGLDGGGATGFKIDTMILIDGFGPADFEGTSVQGRMKDKDLSSPNHQPTAVHELAHNIIGMTNSAHMGGGGPDRTGNLITLEFNSGGWSLIGSAGSSLISCNGFERWRLNWLGPQNNNYPIAANNIDSDVEKGEGNKTFYLRDFITYGDVVRIKLPYLDDGTLNQYIWLENHQIHNNSKEDYPAYWTWECKDDGIPGIYAYYQVGKDILQSDTIVDMYGDTLSELTDHLIPICADGNWDVSLSTDTVKVCVNDNYHYIQEYYQQNPLGGYNDLENHYFNSISGNTINCYTDRMEFLNKLKDGDITNKLANMGDNYDAFTGSAYISMSTNPAPINVVTYHHTRSSTGTITKSSRTDNRKIHLSGLRIDMTDQQNDIFKVDVKWDDYDITEDVRWTGDIVLHEEVNLLSNKTITLDQNYTPNKHIRDPVTDVFAGPTYFTCLNNSSFDMQSNSNVVLQNLSSYVLESGSELEINDGAVFTVKSGCTFYADSVADIVIKGRGKIEIDSGAYICIHDSASITLQDTLSVINLYNGYNSGVNTDVLSDPGNCDSDIPNFSIQGDGSINTFNEDVYIQDTTFTKDAYYAGKNIYAGSNVDPTQQTGPVKVENGAEVIFNAQQNVTIEGIFEIETGSEFKIE